MIEVSKADQLRHERNLSAGLSAWVRGEDGPTAVAAGEIIGETLLMWRKILDSKLQR